MIYVYLRKNCNEKQINIFRKTRQCPYNTFTAYKSTKRTEYMLLILLSRTILSSVEFSERLATGTSSDWPEGRCGAVHIRADDLIAFTKQLRDISVSVFSRNIL